MKVVINTCFGGFGLSEAAVLRYAELKGLTVYPERDEKFGFTNYWTVPESERIGILTSEEFRESDLEARRASNKKHADITISPQEIKRDDPFLVQVVEELEGLASDRYAELKVVEIPDGIEWEIDEYDGNETVKEAHRSWR